MPEQTETIRDQIAACVEVIEPFDELEAEHIRDVLEWIASGVDIFRLKSPDTPPKHLVSYFVLVDPTQESLLLGDHIKGQLWLPSGGHVYAREHPKDTVIREMEEELHKKAIFLHNIDRPFFVTVNTVGPPPGHVDVSLWYFVRGSVHEYIHFDRREFNDVQWFTFDEVLQSAPDIFDQNMHRFTRKLIASFGA
jgi:8-oxo-dGTP diphosphatase